jgi:hypothetical protein
MSFQNLPRELDIQAAPFLARFTSVVTGTGSQNGLHLYGFVEQFFDQATGMPLDANPARTDNLSGPATTYAIEVNNNLVAGLTSTPPSVPLPAWTTPLPSPLPYPFVWMRQRGMIINAVVYEFAAPTPLWHVSERSDWRRP